MDKYNVITPTDNIDDLNKDMSDWSLLPFDIKMRSNDDCMRMHGCTVTDYYNKIKKSILNFEDKNDINNMKNNLVKEDVEFNLNSEDYNNKIKETIFITNSNPYIVIITPDITDINELEKMYNSFNLLNSKLKRLSNDYSWRIWGYNVINMYNIIKSKIGSKESELNDDENNIVKVSNLESTIEGSYDFINNAYLNGNIINILKHQKNLSIIESSNNSRIIKNKLDFSNNDISLSIPKVVPWFTPSELRESRIDIVDSMRYLYYITELQNRYKDSNYNSEYLEEKLLELGWNPSVEMNNKSIEFAREKQIKELNYISCYDISDIDLTKVALNNNEDYNSNLYPLFIIKNEFDNKYVYFSFDSKLDILYKFKSKDNNSKDCLCSNFNGFEKVYKEDIKIGLNNLDISKPIEVYTIFINSTEFELLKNKCEYISNNDELVFIFNSVNDILKNSRNKLDDGCKKVFGSIIIEMIYKLLRYESEDKYIVSKYNTIYQVYIGLFDKYNSEVVDHIISIINNPTILNEYLLFENLDISNSKYLTPYSIIN